VTDGGFFPRPPVQRPLEPTFLLVLGTCLRQAPTRRQGYLLHSQILGLALVLRREKSAVRRGQGGSLPEHILMLFQGGQERIRVRRIPLQNFVTAHDPVLYFVNAHQPTKLVRLMRLPLADHLRMRLKQAQHFPRDVIVPSPYALFRLRDHFLHQRQKVAQLAGLCFHPYQIAHHFESSRFPSPQRLPRLPHHASSQAQQLAIALLHALSTPLRQGLRRAADLQQAMLHRASVIHHLQGTRLAFGRHAFQRAAEHANAVPQKRAVTGIVHIAFHDRGVDANFVSRGRALLARQSHHTVMNLLGSLRTQHREQPAEGAVGGRGLGVKACEAAVDQVAAQFAIELTKAPTLQVQQRSRRSGAIPGRPLRAEAGRRPARQSRTRSTNRGSSRR